MKNFKTGIIDANMHWLPQDLFSNETLLDLFLNATPREYGIHTRIEPITNDPELRQIIIEQPKGYEVLNYAENQYTFEGRIEDMNQAGIERAIFRLPCWQEWLSLDACKMVNDGLAEHISKAPERFSALAVVPPWGSKEAIKEVEYRLTQPGFIGVQLAAHYGQLYLDAPEFKTFFKFLNDLQVPVVVHHTPLPADYASIVPYTNQRRQYGRCVAQATAVGRELFSGLFDEFPNLTLIHSMLGGAFFAFTEMLFPPKLAEYHDEVDRFTAETNQRLREQLKKNIFFDLSGAPQWGQAQLECAVKVIGAENILYGGSYPIRRDWFLKGADYIKQLNISSEDKSLILGENAKRIFKL